jgi:hypothetical protein
LVSTVASTAGCHARRFTSELRHYGKPAAVDLAFIQVVLIRGLLRVDEYTP